MEFVLNGRAVAVDDLDPDESLLSVLRERLQCRSPKDGCSPQGQCGCCTVWVDGTPRVSCVTPARRVAGRSVTTVEGLPETVRRRWAEAFVAQGASQCGFCTPGIVMRMAALEGRTRPADEAAVRMALAAHLCRCTGWQSIVDAAGIVLSGAPAPSGSGRDPLLSAWRAQVEGPRFQSSGDEVVLGGGGFADDTAPPDAWVAVPGGSGDHVLAPNASGARRLAGRVPGRRSTIPLAYPVELPAGPWFLTLRTTWVEPAYLEPDASWCRPGGEPASPLANGGAFGGKRTSPVAREASRLADAHGRPVRVLWSREDVVRRGPKRPPVAIGVSGDGTGTMRMARPAASSDLGPLAGAVEGAAPGLRVEFVDVAGPPVSSDIRRAGWAEAAVITAVLDVLAGDAVHGRRTGVPVRVTDPSGGSAQVSIDAAGALAVDVWAGVVLDEVTLRSYCYGAAHQALSWVRSEGIAVDPEGAVRDLTVRSAGVLPARETPPIAVRVHPGDRWPVRGSDAVFAATAAAAWLADGLVERWPTRRTTERS
jgi:aerobic-type carbon monoxide dehydrogenase small subunit (CoxS/CutS family)